MTLNSKKEEYLIYKLADNMKNCIKIDADLFRKLASWWGSPTSVMWWGMNAPKTV